MKYTNEYLGIELDVPDDWENMSNKFNNVEVELEDLYQKDDKDIPKDEQNYKYLVSSDVMTVNQTQRKTSVILCVHESPKSSKAYMRMMQTRFTPNSDSAPDYTLIKGSASHGDFEFDYIDIIGMHASTRHAWTRLFDNVWLYAHLTDYREVTQRPALKWLGRLKSIPRNHNQYTTI